MIPDRAERIRVEVGEFTRLPCCPAHRAAGARLLRDRDVHTAVTVRIIEANPQPCAGGILVGTVHISCW